MATTDSPVERSRCRAWPVVALSLGISLVGLSLVWPNISGGRANWTEEQALAYQAASARLHELSHGHGDRSAGAVTEPVHPEMQKAQREYDGLRAQLDAARERPAQIATILRYAGILVAVAGIFRLAADRSATS